MTVFDSEHANSVNNGVNCSPQEQKRIVKELNDQAEYNLKEGNLYFVVSAKWFIGWQRYTEQDGVDCAMNGSSPDLQDGVDRPGPIDNSGLLSSVNESDVDNIELSRTLEEGQDYVLVPEEVWKKLLEWYNGGPPLPRKLISQGAINKKFNVEVYPLALKLTDCRDNSQSDISLSKKASILELYEKVCTLKGLPQDKIHIWDYFNEKKQCILVPSNKTLEDADLQMDQHILLELQATGEVSSGPGVISAGKELALVPMEPSRSAVTIAGGPTFSNGYSTRYRSNMYSGLSSSSTVENGVHDSIGSLRKKEKGLAGLQNLGNTCFMNSALQCLVHTAPLAEYFLKDYTDEINKQNPLGMNGELAVAFGELLREMWSSGRTSVAPRHFKGKLARFAPQFSGYNQHDSQELLAFLLDGLHEDLNRVKQKPYIEMKDADGRPDEEYAEECWRSHKARNDSIIVDTCQGQYKSTLVCPACNKISITFDPFMYLSLPLPSMINRTMTVTVLYGNGKGLPMPYTVTVSKHGSCRDLIQALANACCLKNDENLLLAEVYDHKIYRYLESALEPLSSIKDDDHIVAYRVPKKLLGLKKLEIVHQSKEKKRLGSPLVTFLQEERQTVADVFDTITSILSPLRKAHGSSSKNHIEKENGVASSANDEADNGVMDETAGSNNGSDLPFQLTVTEEGLLRSKEVDDDYVKSSPFLRVTLHWTDSEHDLYDISYLEDLPEVCKSGFSAKKTRQEAVSIFSCLDAFLKEEPLGPDDMWYCPNCKEHRQASKKLDLWRLPEILVFHLKRFSYSRYFKNKLDTFVTFPIQNLDLGKYANKDASNVPNIYELYAISNHYGGLGGGHYSAYAKLIDEDRWYHFDDSHVSLVSESEIKTSAAYVLFYRRVKVEEKSEV